MNENTYNPTCKHFDSQLGCCAHPGNDWKVCREVNCPKEIIQPARTE